MRKGQKMPEEARLRLSAIRKLQGNFRLGTKHSEETKKKIGLKQLGNKYCLGKKWNLSPENVEKIRIRELKRFSIKENHPMYGKKHSSESLEKMRKAHLGHFASEDTRKKLSDACKAEKHWNWKGGVTPENKRIRNTAKWREWRTIIFKRDNYTCQECFRRGVNLEPHHIVPIRSDKDNLFNPNNGITLCRSCHQKTVWKESDFADKYFRIVAAQM